MDNSKYFYLSGFLSLFLFGSFFLIFAYILFNNTKTKTYGMKKKNYISVSIELPQPKIKQTRSAKKSYTAPTVTKTTKKIEDIDINDLFSDVWTQKIDHKKKKPKKINAKRLAELQKRIKTTKKNDVEKTADNILGLDATKSKEKLSESAGNEVNEYNAKIQALVYQYFHVPPNTAGKSVEAVIELDPLGKVLDFRILKYSNSQALNEEVDRIKSRLKNVIFPKNPQNRSAQIRVILISQE